VEFISSSTNSKHYSSKLNLKDNPKRFRMLVLVLVLIEIVGVLELEVEVVLELSIISEGSVIPLLAIG
jgi:hypothetical protein